MTSAAMAAALLLAGTALVGAPRAEDNRRSGRQFMSPAVQALQQDDAQNPAMLWVQDGEQLWRTPAGSTGKRCADCHGEARAQHGWRGRPLPGLGRGQRRRAEPGRPHQRLPPAPPTGSWRWRSSMPTCWACRPTWACSHAASLSGHPTTRAWRRCASKARPCGSSGWGQLNMACLHCHDQRAGLRLGGATIPQGHATGYPTYRLEWQALGSLQRRLRGCVVGVRAEPWAPDAPEWLALEAWLAQRAAGMAVETPAVRP